VKKYILTILAGVTFFLYSKSQNPESGWFWSYKMNETHLDKATGKYEGMGWSETSTGEYAFKFTATEVTAYYEGWMGKKYKRQRTYSVINRKMVGTEGELTVYDYNLAYGNDTYKIIIKANNTEGYKGAQIQFLENINSEGFFEKQTIYRCTREF
jgi:hypothetical protein